MSIGLKIDEVMPPYEDAKESDGQSASMSPRLKMILIGIVAAGAIGGAIIAYLVVNAPERPTIDTSGKTMTVDIAKNTGENPELLEKKLGNPNIIANYFHDHPVASAEHPLDPAVEVARIGLKYGREKIKDYTAVMHKRERINGKLATKEIVELKVRHDSISEGMEQSPMSVYVKFLEPKKMAGREVIWKKGRNKDKLTVHEYSVVGNVQLNLPPNGFLAMQGNRYPLTEIGLETLVLRMIEKGTRDRKYGECEVKVNRTAKINDRDCTLIEIIHEQKRDHFEFHIAKIFIDDEYNIPLRYAAYSWPKEEGGKPVLEEEYTFTDIVINPGLTDIDFDVTNPKYDFPNKKSLDK